MANISKEVNIEMLEKLPDGTYKKKNPATKAELVKETAQKKFVSDAEKAEIAKVKDKADKTYVDSELNKKSDETYVDLELSKKETPAGAQTKATKALTDSKVYTDSKVKTDVPAGALFTDTIVDISGKVDKVAGKDLSANDYTNAEKAEVAKVKNKAEKSVVDAHLADYASYKTNTSQSIEDIKKELANYSSYASNKDDNGIFTVVEYKRDDITLYIKSTLSNPDGDENYQTLTWQLYDNAGTSVIETIVWDIVYDDDGDIVSKVVVS